MSRRQPVIFDPRKLVEARKTAGKTHEQLARDIDVTLRTVQRWQDGQSEPRGTQLFALAMALGVSPEQFFSPRPLSPDPEDVAA